MSVENDVREIKEKVDRIDRLLRGDDKQPGLWTKIVLLEAWRTAASKFGWLMIAAAATSVVGAIVSVIAGGGGVGG